MFDNFKNKKILITGHTGFKGSWLSSWLLHLGAEVIGVSNGVPTNPSHFESAKLNNKLKDIRADITQNNEIKNIIESTEPDFIFHLAAQSLVESHT